MAAAIGMPARLNRSQAVEPRLSSFAYAHNSTRNSASINLSVVAACHSPVTQKVLLRCYRAHIVLRLCQFVFPRGAGGMLFANRQMMVPSPNDRRASGCVHVRTGKIGRASCRERE